MLLIVNRKAKFDYQIIKKWSAGLVLIGAEVKSLRHKSGSLQGSYVKILSGEVFLLNAQITPYKFADNREYDPLRTRKLLLKKREIDELTGILQQKGLTLVPLSLVLEHNRIKLNIGLGRGLKQFEKRDKIKKRDQQREIARVIKQKNY